MFGAAIVQKVIYEIATTVNVLRKVVVAVIKSLMSRHKSPVYSCPDACSGRIQLLHVLEHSVAAKGQVAEELVMDRLAVAVMVQTAMVNHLAQIFTIIMEHMAGRDIIIILVVDMATQALIISIITVKR